MYVGSIVKYFRMKNNMTQGELAEGICSVSHLSKIESNKYEPHTETMNELFKRMNVEWAKEVQTYTLWKEKLENFIRHSIYYNWKAMENLYEELIGNEEYLQSTDLLNRYELYTLRYNLYKRDMPKATQQMTVLNKLEATFDDYEKGISKVLYFMYDIFSQKYEQAERRLQQIEAYRERIPFLFEGELYYQKAYLLHTRAQYGRSSYFAELAVEHFQKDCNYIRLLHAQLLLAITYTNRDLILQAEELFKIVLRNSKMMELDELYQGALYNYSELQNRRGLHESAFELLMELRALIVQGTDYYQAILIHLLHTAVEEDIDTEELLKELEVIAARKNDAYLSILTTYFRKAQISQQELFDYCEEIAFPFLSKHGYIKEARSTAWKLADYYRSIGDEEKMEKYSLYYYVKGDEET
ncbi:helix-turn-helix domain-containing protein [Sporosarcina sp. OR05]|uniref:helix-turn-helix domain-containing protein n=1 Tax=Sporosarcina sp. OR05 TaxID=2969819 RepID=UPI003529D98E